MKYPFLSLKELNAPMAAEIKEAVGEVIDSGRYILGENVAKFESKLASLCETKYAIGCSNGLDALRLILRGYIELGVMNEGDQIIVPANTYIASVLAISDAGLMPVFADADIRTMNLNTSLVEPLITSRTRGIMTVHLYGTPCWDENLTSLASKYNLKIIEDNAQAIVAKSATTGLFATHTTGGLGNAAGNSFYPTKNLGAIGDAGAITTNDENLASTVRALLNYGSDRRYHNIFCGFNCRLDELQATILLVKLKYLNKETEHRQHIAKIYNDNISNPLLQLPAMNPDDTQVWHQYVVRTAERNRFRKYLEDNGVGSDIHYATPPCKQPCYSQFSNLVFPATEKIASEVTSIPVSSMTSEDDALAICAIINRFK